jgi:PAS domain S-box-containing protein
MQNHAIIISDAKGIIRVWSEGAETLFGYTGNEAIGRRVDLVVPPHLRDDHWKGFDRAMRSGGAGGEGQFFDIPGLHKAGEVKTFRAQLHLLRDEQKIPIGAMVIFADRGSG